jgi:hypothetical protein
LNFFVGSSVLGSTGGGETLRAGRKERDHRSNSREEQKALLRSLWIEHNILFPTEEDCMSDILKRLELSEAIKCPNCGCKNIKRIEDDNRTGTCKSCSTTVWLTAGTFFDHMKAPRAWHAAIWLKERGAIFNNKQFHELVGIASSSTWNILKRIEIVIKSHMDSDNSSVPSALFTDVYGRRSRMTPKEVHPSYEEEDSVKDVAPKEKTHEGTSKPDLSEFEQELYDLLSEKPVHCDALMQQLQQPISEILSGLTILEVAGLVNATGGGRYARTNPEWNGRSSSNGHSTARPASTLGNETSVKPIIDFIKSVFQSVSRKYVQLYTATHWLHIDRTTWGTDSLFQACVKFRDICEEEILDFVSPSMVMIRSF